MKNPKKLDNSKLIAYSAVAGAALAVAPNAFATIVHSLDGRSFGEGHVPASIDLTMEGSNAEFWLTGNSYYSSGQSGTAFIFYIDRKDDINKTASVWGAGGYYVKPIATGAFIGQSTNTPDKSKGRFCSGVDFISTEFTSYNGSWTQDGQASYVGVSFDKEAGGKVYGWIKIERLTRASGKIIDWAYEDDGTKIPAGALPEPATGLALLALGAAGIAAYRRK